ncbi:uncharacterized protein Bfra_003705 [Botrytis fragariae]|uniref:Uncharacterized protein n=1 Tax=Botrytis fragariae TaxID=1964551 RepID=A0A8H6EK57_9HELO|nr:uncharacterized protein Bfra_003705 [Botrytis fragariae]KAF5875252.1 hypothetical protein Bfra_003705 [Botrytis fragariae]
MAIRHIPPHGGDLGPPSLNQRPMETAYPLFLYCKPVVLEGSALELTNTYSRSQDGDGPRCRKCGILLGSDWMTRSTSVSLCMTYALDINVAALGDSKDAGLCRLARNLRIPVGLVSDANDDK